MNGLDDKLAAEQEEAGVSRRSVAHRGQAVYTASASESGALCGARSDASLVVTLPGGAVLLAVVTGVGGETGGEDLARVAVESLHTTLLDADPQNEQQARQALHRAFVLIHKRLKKIVADVTLRQGVALTAGVLVGPLWVVGHFGHTAAFVAQERRLVRVSPPHLTRLPQAPEQSVVRLSGRLLGHDPAAMVEITVSELAPGEGVLLVSPPLVDALKSKEVRRLFLAPLSPGELTRRLARAAVGLSPHTQATAVAGFVGVSTLALEQAAPMPRWQKAALAGLLLAAAAGFVGVLRSGPVEKPAPVILASQPLSGFVDVYTTPAGAQVFFNGRYQPHLTPHRVRTGKKGGELLLEKAGYASERLWLEPHGEPVLKVSLKPLVKTAETLSPSAPLSGSQSVNNLVSIISAMKVIQLKVDNGEWMPVVVGQGGRLQWFVPSGKHTLSVRAGSAEYTRPLTMPTAEPVKWFIPAEVNRGDQSLSGSAGGKNR